MDIIATLQSLYPDFTKTEKKVADFMLHETDGHSLMRTTLSNVANVTGVGQATVIRVIKHCGYDSFRTFMADLSHAKFQAHAANSMIQGTEGPFNNITLQLRLCDESLDRRQLRQAAQIISRADLIVCTGYGNSSHIAALAASHFRRAQLAAVQSVPGEIGFDVVNGAAPPDRRLKTVVLAFSVSGESPILIKMVERYEMDGACILGITSHEKSSLARLSNFVFLTPSSASERNSGRWIDGMINQLYIVEVLAEEVYRVRYSKEEM